MLKIHLQVTKHIVGLLGKLSLRLQALPPFPNSLETQLMVLPIKCFIGHKDTLVKDLKIIRGFTDSLDRLMASGVKTGVTELLDAVSTSSPARAESAV